jgi:hypothetical protein
MTSKTISIDIGKELTLTTDAASSGTYVRVEPGAQYTPAAIAASSTVLVGPFNEPRHYRITSDLGLIATSQEFSGIYTAVDSDIQISDLGDGVDGELITWDANGAPAAVAVGTATHVLTSNGAGAAPTFQVAGGGIAGIVEDTTPQLGGELELNGNYIDFGVSSTGSAYNLVSSGGVPRLTGAANYFLSFTSTSLFLQAGTSWNTLKVDNSAGLTYTFSNVLKHTTSANGLIINDGSLKLKSFTVAGVPSASTHGAGAQIFVTDETGGAINAFSDGTNWRRVTDRAVVS